MNSLTLARRGFSLLELLIAITIMILAIAMAGAAFSLQNTALQAMELTRVANADSRDALLSLEGGLRQAGWGVDPRYAIDLFSANPSIDRADAPDQLTFIARDPSYQWLDNGQGACVTPAGCFAGHAWPVTAMTAGPPVTLAITLLAGQTIHSGQMVQVLCAGAENPVLLTVTGDYAAGDVVLSSLASPAFPYNDTVSIRPCHGAPGAAVFLVNRSRYFIATFGGVPWLMLDPGVDVDGDGVLPPADADDMSPIAKNVEDMQVAYLLSGTGAGPDNDGDWIIGNTVGTVELPVAPVNVNSLPTYVTDPADASRRTMASANVRGVRISLIIRSSRPDPNKGPNFPGDVLAYPENRTGSAAGNKVRRYSAVSQISLRNLESTRPFTF